MTITGEKLIDKLQAGQDMVTLHLAAQTVMKRAHGSGRGTFRVDDLRPDLAEQLPDYVGGYVGSFMPTVWFDEQGEICGGGSTRVNPGDDKFELVNSWVDEETGEHRSLMRWHPRDTESLSETDDQSTESVISLPNKSKHWGRIALIGISSLTNVLGIGMMLKGNYDEAHLGKNANSEAIADARQLQNTGLAIEATLPIVGGLAAIGYGVRLIRKRPEQ